MSRHKSFFDPVTTRRDFLTTGTAAAFGIAHGLPQGFPWTLSTTGSSERAVLQGTLGVATLRDPRIKALVARALDAARAAGARYADVRVTNTRMRSYFNVVKNREALGLSVRALVDGVWGFASSPSVTDGEATRLARLAVANAKSIGGSSPVRIVELGTIPTVPNGDWTTPIRIDPFEVAEGEILDWMYGLERYANDYGRMVKRNVDAVFVISRPPLIFTKQERVVGTTEGSYLTQTLYKTDSQLMMKLDDEMATLPGTVLVGAGWEAVYDHTVQMREAIPQLIAQLDAAREMPVKPVEVGRYEVVFSASAMANVLSRTLGTATELDRALGYEANAGGTSYLGPDPRALLGMAVASPLVTVSANRSVPRGLATVQWDDEGVVPEEFALVERGTLVDYQTTREHAAWLASWYQTRGHAVRSHGCAGSPTALELTMQHTPNLTLHPGPGTDDFESLIAGMASGIAVENCNADMDFQCLNGLGMCTAYEVKKGKRVAQVTAAKTPVGVLFRSPELWKNVLALGGPASARLFGFNNWSEKGEPQQSTDYSVSAVPAVVKGVAVIDPTKKA